MPLRELVNEIGFKIDLNGLRRAQREGDRVSDNIVDSFRDMGADVDRVINHVDDSIRNIRDPHIDTTNLRNQLDLSRREIEDLRQEIRRLEDQFNRSSNNMGQDANNLKSDLMDIAGGLGGGAAGGIIGGDITSFAQLTREYRAQLGVSEFMAAQMTENAKQIWAELPGISKEAAAESLAASYRYFKVTGDRARELGRSMAMLHEQTGMEISILGLYAKQLDERFEDIQSPEQAINMMVESSQRLSPTMFEEMIDQVDEYGVRVAAAGIKGADFFEGMTTGGEKGRFVMDRLGDSLANEFIGRLAGEDQTVIDALTELSGSSKKVKEWRKSIISGGEEGSAAVKEILGAFTSLNDAQEQAALGVQIFGTLYEEQGPAMIDVYKSMSQETEEFGTDIEALGVRNEGIINSMKSKWKELRSWIDGTAGETFGAGAEALGGAMPFIGAFLGAGGIGKVGSVLGGIGSKLTPVLGFFRAAAPLVMGFGRALLIIGGVAGGTIAVIAGLGYAGYQLYENWDAAKAWMLGVFQSIGSGAKGMANGAISAVNGVIGAMNGLDVTVPEWVPVYGGRHFGLNIPQIPMLAEGGTAIAPGLSIVGEEGPELLHLGRGASVIPLPKARANESAHPAAQTTFSPKITLYYSGSGGVQEAERFAAIAESKIKTMFPNLMEEFVKFLQLKMATE